MLCCICGKEITGFGNNPAGAACLDAENKVKFLTFAEDERCCDECNNAYVLPGRIYTWQENRKNKEN